ncbi:MAG: RrF2 family transcriptional regulator [Bacillota bacterium]|uniref:Transcriptional regulator, BadM/Rrf2 family n=2 Tax=Carboxydocella TaxID=178898 RepID=A0A1T4MEF1_9FIRM|nr:MULTISPECIES: Rrf2 family transcriptional regulator [Carboxydocella]AVX21288.1 transcriptional regulator, BadM/Rrf2 family [Carboxydocella thermautotrophica]AVX31720.1 transcriptional regulator, BadM/Rrf2 family [Carboxydocella thermautotrophica]GAW29334.1 transcriptional regulator [Carboxydocella sp. ULO1]SJZ65293.1 transcriptional regulator, BadM/Rrf2 family [Carboxydocella sporoproducens DSM 16521]
MVLNQATDYALRAVACLVRHQGEKVEAQQIAREEVIPMRFLLKIMPSLIKAGIVRSIRGAGGGYQLAKKPKEITFLEVVEAIEGPLAINKCLLDYAACNKKGAPACSIHQALARIQGKLVEALREQNFANL